jgi:hypothetical protein
MGHVAHGVQVSAAVVLRLIPVLKVANSQVSHSRSLLAVATVLVNKPAAHLALTGTQAAPLSTAE